MTRRAQARNPSDDPGAYLGAELARLRIDAGYDTQDAIAAALSISRSRITQVETGEAPPDAKLLIAWATTCKAPAEWLARMVCDLARLRDDAGPVWFKTYHEAEAQAHTILCWHPMAVPGLLQTAAYATELLQMAQNDDELIARYLEVRLKRQQALDRPQPPDLSVVLDETTLRRRTGTPEVMREQLGHIVELGSRRNITVQVVPLSSGMNIGHVGGMHIASILGRPDVLLSEGVQDVTTVKPHAVIEARRFWERIRSEALPRAASMDLIREAARE
jgi:transcriptional regulator with XRE-family HTH domain